MTSPKHTEARPAGARRDARGNRRQRGVALLIAVVAITILTVVATEFAYNTRVDLQLAANQRDEVQAMYMARSGVALSRLLLRFQKQVDQTPIPNIGGMLSQLDGRRWRGPGRTAAGLLAQHPAVEAGACGLPHAQGPDRGRRRRGGRRRRPGPVPARTRTKSCPRAVPGTGEALLRRLRRAASSPPSRTRRRSSTCTGSTRARVMRSPPRCG